MIYWFCRIRIDSYFGGSDANISKQYENFERSERNKTEESLSSNEERLSKMDDSIWVTP